MSDNHRNFTLYGRPPLYQLVVSVIIILGLGLFLFLLFGLTGTMLFTGGTAEMSDMSKLADNGEIGFLRYLMIFQGISFFFVPGLVILKLLEPESPFLRRYFMIPAIKEVGLVIILAFCVFPVSSFTGQLNSEMQLPDWLSGIEKWMMEKEDSISGLFDQIIPSGSFPVLLLNLLMVAIIPGIGEELVFRGVIQKIAYSLFPSKHLAVLATAFLFSAIHLQFFGFIPRLILGLIFGYLYLWSGNLWLPVIAHFVNNSVPVIGAYIKGWESINLPSDMTLWKQLPTLPLPVIAGAIILMYFRNRSKELTG